ncbi:hypothetical protein CCS38_34105, partial [Streptomyces purpurogeneiscleroticus]|nr:hypothetical protein [Streptomyces purpurogeneiscleroticus]
MRWFGAGAEGAGEDATPDERAGLVTVYGTGFAPADGGQPPARPPSAARPFVATPLGGGGRG